MLLACVLVCLICCVSERAWRGVPGRAPPVPNLEPASRNPAQVHEMVREIFKKEPNRSMNPDEVVAMGAAIQVRAVHALHACVGRVRRLDRAAAKQMLNPIASPLSCCLPLMRCHPRTRALARRAACCAAT